MSQHTTNAAFFDLPSEVIEEMETAKNAAASEFWAYPGEAWQYAFEEDWLRQRGYEAAADLAAACAAEV